MKVDRLEREYWAAWEASKEERQTTTTEQTADAEAERLKADIRKKERTGDPRYLAGVERCIAKRCGILGLNAPHKVAPTTPDGERPYQLVVKGMTDDDLAAIERLAERYHELARGAGAGGLN